MCITSLNIRGHQQKGATGGGVVYFINVYMYIRHKTLKNLLNYATFYRRKINIVRH